MKTKVAHILNSVGGVDIYLRTILENLDYSKFDVVVICSDQNKAEFKKYNSNIVEYKIPIRREINPLNDLKTINQCLAILKDEKPDLIHCHSAKGGVIGRIVGNKIGINQLYTPNAFSFLSTDNKIKQSVYKKIERFLFRKKSFLLACSTSEKNRAKFDLNVPEEQLLLWENSIAPIFNPSPLKALELPAKYICTVSRPSFQKNLPMMIEAFATVSKEITDLKLIIAGIGHYAPDLGELRDSIAKYKLENKITLIDWTDRENIFHLIKNSISYISTSRYEGLPYSIIESFALGTPCIATNCDGNKDLIQNNYNGFLVELHDTKTLADKIIELVKSTELQKKFRENALTSYTENYNVLNNISKLEEIYRQYAKTN